MKSEIHARKWNDREFVSIDTKLILDEGHSPFELYFFPEGVDAPVLYCQTHVELSPAERERLVEGHVEALYLSSDNREAYRRYVEDNLASLLKSDDMGSEEKMGVLYEAAHTLMADVFDDPRSTESIARSRKLVEHTVDYVIDQGNVLTDFQGIMSYDYHLYTHSVNVCVYGLSLALKLGIDDTEVLREFDDALILRDVG